DGGGDQGGPNTHAGSPRRRLHAEKAGTMPGPRPPDSPLDPSDRPVEVPVRPSDLWGAIRQGGGEAGSRRGARGGPAWRRRGLGRSGLYYYVRSKEELLFLIQDHCFGTVLENVERLLEGETDPVRRLRLFVENHVRFFVNNMREMKVLSHEADSLSGEYRRRVQAKKKKYTDLCMSILEELRPVDSRIDPRVATFALFGMLNWIYNWYHPGRDVPVAELADGFSRLFLQGCLSPAS